jgi:hypothetical protein
MSEENKWTIDYIHSSLSNTSVELHYILWNVPREEQVKRPSPEEWSPLEILIHMRQVGEVYAERVKRVVDQEEDDDIPYMHNFDEKRQMSKIDLDEETVKHNLGDFMEARSELLNKISFLEEEKWDSLKCEHETDGIISLRELLIPLVNRELEQLKRLEKLLNAKV